MQILLLICDKRKSEVKFRNGRYLVLGYYCRYSHLYPFKPCSHLNPIMATMLPGYDPGFPGFRRASGPDRHGSHGGKHMIFL